MPHVVDEGMLPVLQLLLAAVALPKLLLVVMEEVVMGSVCIAAAPNKLLHGVRHDPMLRPSPRPVLARDP